MFILPDLPYSRDALAPTVSERTLHFHHDKHHAAYVKTVNELIGGEGSARNSLEEVIRQARGADKAKLFNNAAQAWNHAFFWNSMAPGGAAPPSGELGRAITETFGGPAQLSEAFVAEGAGHFASGWVWLAADRSGSLTVVSTHDAETLAADEGATPLIVCDLWEHAYYLDYQNDRKGFLTRWFEALPNWSFAEGQWRAARGEGQPWRYPPPAA